VFNTLEKHDIDLIIEIELKKLYARLTELGYKLTSSEKESFIAEKVLKQFGARPLKKPFRNTLKTHLLKRLLLLKFLLMKFSWILKRSSRAKCKVHKAEEPTKQ
jgi:ATP-dependent Clp protease ATP-binding subunit ClpC